MGEEEFEREVVAAPTPVIVDFHAEWCAPCKWVLPYLAEAAREGEGRLRVVRVDTDAAPGLAERFRIASVPTVVLFEDGREVARSVGVEPEKIRAMVARVT